MTATKAEPNLATALTAFQAALPHIGKANTANTGTYSYKYADLAEISALVLPALAAQGLAWTCKPTLDDQGRFVLAYKLSHVSGESEDGVYPLGNLGQPQVMGSAITYARRYCLCSVTGVAPDQDDDGAAAQQHARTQQADPEPQPQPGPEKWAELVAAITAAPDSDAVKGLWRSWARAGIVDLPYTAADGITLNDLLRQRSEALKAAPGEPVQETTGDTCSHCDGTGKAGEWACGPCNATGVVGGGK